MALDISRSTTGVSDLLPKQISSEIWANTLENSAAMKLARRINLPGTGLTIPVITGDAQASWVNETDVKPVSQATLGSKQMTGYTLAVIEPFSNQFKRDLPGLYEELKRRLPYSLGKKFDETVFGGTAPGSNFDTLAGVPKVAVDGTNTWGDLLAVNSSIAAAGGRNSGYAITPQGESTLMGAVDAQGRPMFASDLNNTGSIGAVQGRPIYVSKAVGNPTRLGYAGDWDSAVYGVVEDISISFSDQATLTWSDGTMKNLWERNMFALRAEIEVGFVVRDKKRFVELTTGA